MLRVVFDTSVYIAAFVTRGTAKQVLDLARGRNKKIQLLTSVEIMNELGQKLREKFFWPERRIKETIKAITHIAEIIQPQHSLKVLSDEEDNRILECAVGGNADLIVSRDRHLLTMEKYQIFLLLSRLTWSILFRLIKTTRAERAKIHWIMVA